MCIYMGPTGESDLGQMRIGVILLPVCHVSCAALYIQAMLWGRFLMIYRKTWGQCSGSPVFLNCLRNLHHPNVRPMKVSFPIALSLLAVECPLSTGGPQFLGKRTDPLRPPQNHNTEGTSTGGPVLVGKNLLGGFLAAHLHPRTPTVPGLYRAPRPN